MVPHGDISSVSDSVAAARKIPHQFEISPGRIIVGPPAAPNSLLSVKNSAVHAREYWCELFFCS